MPPPPHAPSDPQWTTRQLLAWTTKHFRLKHIDSPRLASEMLLAHVLGVPRLKLYMDPDRPATPLERAALRDLVQRAAHHEPVDYLVAQAPFFSMMFHVDPAVLIPRPSTETLVDHVIQHARRTPGFATPRIADLGTGSGAIAIALAKNIPNAHIIATDISPTAIAIAKQNAKQHNVADRIQFQIADMLDPLDMQPVQYLVSNPPYISDDEWLHVPPNVKNFEPHTALRAGVDGLKFIRPLIQLAHHALAKPAQLVLEIAASQKQQALQLADHTPTLANPHVLADHEHLPRVLVADSA